MLEVQVGLAIIAVTEALKRILPSVVQSYVIIIVAAVLGLLAGFAGIEGLNWWTGLIVGLTASGSMTVARAIAGK